jgi:hypothetical protein
MSSHFAVTVPPKDEIRVRPAAGMDSVLVKITTVFPVGIPLAVLLANVGLMGTGAEVGRSEHATTAAPSTSEESVNRAASFVWWCMNFLVLE